MFVDGAYLFDAGWLFFAAWSVALLMFSLVAFGEDLLPQRERADTTPKKTQNPLRSTNAR